MLDWLWENADKLGYFGQVVTALVAGIGLGFAWGQISSSRRSQAEATAKHLWRGFEAACLQHPHFANPSLAQVDVDKRMFDGDALKFEQYEWFVSIFLNASEEIFYCSSRADWRHSIRHNVRVHAALLRAAHKADAHLYYRKEFYTFVRDALRSAR